MRSFLGQQHAVLDTGNNVLACRQPDASVEDLQVELMVLQRQLAEAQGRHESELAAESRAHAGQLASLQTQLNQTLQQVGSCDYTHREAKPLTRQSCIIPSCHAVYYTLVASTVSALRRCQRKS